MATAFMTALALLPHIGAFSELPKPVLKKLAQFSGLQRLGKGSVLFYENDRPQFVYALAEGKVSLFSGRESEEIIIDFIDTGDIVLIPPALLGLPYMVSAKAVSDLLVIMMPVGKFRHLTEQELPLSAAINKTLSQHWRLLLRHLMQTKFKDADSRLVHFLLNQAGNTHGPASLTLPGRKHDLAAHLGMTPATLSRSFKRLSQWGVKTTGTKIDIENVPKLGAHLQQIRPGNSQRSSP